MDNITPLPSASERVKAAAREAGIGPAEPLGPVIEALADIPGEVNQSLDQHAATISELLRKHAALISETAPEATITVEDIRTLSRAAGRNAQSEMVYAAQAVVKQLYWRMTAIGAAALLTGGLVCGGLGASIMRFVTPLPPVLTYADQPDGSRIGYYFVRAATRAADVPSSAAPPPTKKGHQ